MTLLELREIIFNSIGTKKVCFATAKFFFLMLVYFEKRAHVRASGGVAQGEGESESLKQAPSLSTGLNLMNCDIMS